MPQDFTHARPRDPQGWDFIGHALANKGSLECLNQLIGDGAMSDSLCSLNHDKVLSECSRLHAGYFPMPA
jgi:hypothetical protein